MCVCVCVCVCVLEIDSVKLKHWALKWRITVNSEGLLGCMCVCVI